VTIRLYMDEDSMSHALVRALKARGVDVTTALEEGMINRSDEAHLEYATAQGRVLCTFNVADFYHIHTAFLAEDKNHAGIVLVQQQQYTVGEQMRRLLRLMSVQSAEAMQNQVEFLSAWA
jgi:endonuclease V-like protein UPF0215 family